MSDLTNRVWVEIDLTAIEHNYYQLRSNLPKNCKLLGVVKANAYGHGTVPIGRKLEELGCDYLGVACLEEAQELRNAGIRIPILIFGYTPIQYTRLLVEEHITQTISSIEMARAYSNALAGTGLTLTVHIKLETGMGRTGFNASEASCVSMILESVTLPNLYTEGIYTHFCVSDAPKPDNAFTEDQFLRFMNIVHASETELGCKFTIRHCANSGAVFSFPDTCLDMVRPGIALYGAYAGNHHEKISLIPAMSLKTRIVHIGHFKSGDTISYGRTFAVSKPSNIAVLPVGYADGLHRVLSNRLLVRIGNAIVRQVGIICMDMCMIDTTGFKAHVGDEVELFGRNIPIEDVAKAAETINYEILCSIGPRVPRVYK